jgi:hypothetical protein
MARSMGVRQEYRSIWRKPGSFNLPASPRLKPGGWCGLEAGAPATALLPGLAAYRQETYLQLP